ncbi:DUF6332 family protein [Streptomyces oceani]|uniref:Uncharacterized protein n=1 Tax=Streptomyces oceani TaxID=1075402 RepID=A0A1E7JY09_9ACTN|nr:DUF6332 family protein [Streptomyces oceani]OEU96505.1 hypothetical protein AN216_19620 [Streptomyces oceani]
MDAQWPQDDGPQVPAKGPPTQDEREATTVEIVFAIVSGGLLAGATFLALASPALFWHGSSGWITHAQWVGSAVFIARVLWVLLRWDWRHPSQPGRTSPDS